MTGVFSYIKFSQSIKLNTIIIRAYTYFEQILKEDMEKDQLGQYNFKLSQSLCLFQIQKIIG